MIFYSSLHSMFLSCLFIRSFSLFLYLKVPMAHSMHLLVLNFYILCFFYIYLFSLSMFHMLLLYKSVNYFDCHPYFMFLCFFFFCTLQFRAIFSLFYVFCIYILVSASSDALSVYILIGNSLILCFIMITAIT